MGADLWRLGGLRQWAHGTAWVGLIRSGLCGQVESVPGLDPGLGGIKEFTAITAKSLTGRWGSPTGRQQAEDPDTLGLTR
jgi:hypothetical protein